MTAAQRRRAWLALAVSAGVAAGVGLMLYAFGQNLLYFYSPAQVAAGAVAPGVQFRLGGLVEAGSVERDADSLAVRFALTDLSQTIAVRHHGLLPDLFREGQGIVALGRLDEGGVFVATEVLAKHDENYMPPEVADALARQGAQHPVGIPR